MKKNNYESVIKLLINQINNSGLDTHQKFNLYSAFALVVMTIIITMPNYLSAINDMFATILNGIAAIINGTIVNNNNQNNDSLKNLLLSILVILIESIICKIFCYFYNKIKN